MIKLTDASVLALTKLRTHKVRTLFTIIASGILFALLVAGSLVTTGILDSIKVFTKNTLNDRYIVQVNKAFDPTTIPALMRSKTLISRAKEIHTQTIEAKKTEAKKLGIIYDSASEPLPYVIRGSNSEEVLSINNPATGQALFEYFKDRPTFNDDELNKIAIKYHAIDIFDSTLGSLKPRSSLTVLKDGKESFVDSSSPETETATYEQPFFSNGISIFPRQLAESFMLPNAANWQPTSGQLPIILPQDKLEQLLGIPPLQEHASAQTQLERIKEIRAKATALEFAACYRNDISLAQIQQAFSATAEIAQNTSNKDYKKPHLIYGLPDSSRCESASIVSDTRTDTEKNLGLKQKTFDTLFGKVTDPVQYMVHFKVVGISPKENNGRQGGAQSGKDIIQDTLTTGSIGTGIPADLYQQVPAKQKYDSDILVNQTNYLFGNTDNTVRYVEFNNPDDALKFINEQSCKMQYDNTCQPAGRQYQATLQFSNSAAIRDLSNQTARVFTYSLLGVIALATIIMGITVGRTIADGRKETAVFRAIGFKRIDITLIYLIYTLVLSLLIALLAFSTGYLTTVVIDGIYGPGLTATAQLTFSGTDLSKEFALLGINSEQLLIILSACIATGLVSALPPLLHNVRRNPIQDMRDE